MKQSDTIGELAKALSKAQAEIKHAMRSGKNPHFSSTYATLEDINNVIREPLANNELSYIQLVGECNFTDRVVAIRCRYGAQEKPVITVTISTQIMHSSGEWIISTSSVPAVDISPHSYGSAVTYGRRYTLGALLGVVTEDDDGNSAASYQQYESTNTRNKAPAVAPSIPKNPTDHLMKAARELYAKINPTAEELEADPKLQSLENLHNFNFSQLEKAISYLKDNYGERLA